MLTELGAYISRAAFWHPSILYDEDKSEWQSVGLLGPMQAGQCKAARNGKIKPRLICDNASCSAACGCPPAPCCQCIKALSGAALTLLRSMSLHNEGRL
jgi:hypothetical protein